MRVTAPPRTEILERYFRQYPDVPREVILKTELQGLGHWFTDRALAAAKGSLVKSYRLFSYDLIPMKQMEHDEARLAPECFFIFQGPYDLRPLLVQTTMSPDSPYVVDVLDGRLVLMADDQVLCNVGYPIAPKYYSKRFPDGTRYYEIISTGYFVTVFRSCQYWCPKEECRFCDINENRRQMKESQAFRDYLRIHNR